jgi:hypothetical protein
MDSVFKSPKSMSSVVWKKHPSHELNRSHAHAKN